MRDPGGDQDRTGADGAGGKTKVGRLRHRADFLRAAKGKRWHGRAFSLQASREGDAGSRGDVGTDARIGLTLTKKVGNAVVRNRARRRLREAIRLHPALPVAPARDYVLIARVEAIRVPFSALQDELARALRSVDASRGPSKGRSQDRGERPRREADPRAKVSAPQE